MYNIRDNRHPESIACNMKSTMWILLFKVQGIGPEQKNKCNIIQDQNFLFFSFVGWTNRERVDYIRFCGA